MDMIRMLQFVVRVLGNDHLRPVTLEQFADTRGHDRGSNIAKDHGLMSVAPVSHARVVVAEHSDTNIGNVHHNHA